MIPNNYIDISGHRFGKWVVLSDFGPVSKIVNWKCQCDCGTIRTVSGGKLRQGMSQSCGCSNAKNLEGQTFGTWTVRSLTRDHEGTMKWLCCSDDRYMLFSYSELLHQPPPQPLADFVKGKKSRNSSNTYGTWKVLHNAGDLLETDKKTWRVAFGCKGYVVAQCNKSNWIGVFHETQLTHENPPGYPAEKKVERPKKGHDLTGNIFGSLKALERVGTTERTRLAIWRCICIECGIKKEVNSMLLKRKSTCANCSRLGRKKKKLKGLSKKQRERRRQREENTLAARKEKFCGNTFGTWKVCSYAGKDHWRCCCEMCGMKKSYSTLYLKKEPECQCNTIEVGTVYGAYLVHCNSGYTDWGTPLWGCECTKCGDAREYVGATLMSRPVCKECENEGIQSVIEEKDHCTA